MYAARYFGPRFYGRRYFGKTGETVEGQYFGGRYFGGWYWGHRYWGPDSTNVLGTHFGGRYWGSRFWGRHYFGTKGTPGFIVAPTGPSLAGSLTFGSAAFVYTAAFPVAQSSALALAATIGISGALSFDGDTDFSVTPPIDLPGMTGNLLLSGSLSINDGGPALPGSYWGRRYWGAHFYGPRYWGRGAAFTVVSSTGLSLSGSVGVAGDITTTAIVSPTSLAAALTGVIGLDQATLVITTPQPEDPEEPEEPIGGGYGEPPRIRPRQALSDDNQAQRIAAANARLIELVSMIVASGALD